MWSRIGVYKDNKDPYVGYFDEALEHGGMAYKTVEFLTDDELSRLDVLLLAGYGQVNESQELLLTDWVERGGALVCCGSSWQLNRLLGLSDNSLHASNLVIRNQVPDRLWPDKTDHIRFFGGILYQTASATSIAGTTDGWAGICRNRVAKGLAVFLGPHVGQTVALMQLGRSVETDGIGPSDGSATLDDGLLRSEDGTALSFEHDRVKLGDSGVPFFAYPHADMVRELLMRAMLEAVDHSGKSTTLIWPWPNMAPAAITLTLDCEDLNPEHVHRMYQLLSMHGCPATWLIPSPGYPLDIYRSIRAWEHEVGCLFMTENNGGWSGEHLKSQRTTLVRSAAVATAYTARPHNGFWRGWDSFYDMCEVAGARISVSKGGRQPGTAGFLFGTSKPFFTLKKDGVKRLVLELPYTIFMPGEVTPDATCDAIFAQTLQHNGCFHIVCRPEAASMANVSNSLRRMITNARGSRVAFMTPEHLYQFEKGRRSIRVNTHENEEGGQILLIPDVRMEGLTLLISGPTMSVDVRGKPAQYRTFERYGTKFTTIQVNVDQKQHLEIRLFVQAPSKVA